MSEKMKIPATGEWSFKTEAVAEGFDAHVREQLPWYELVTRAIAHIASHYVPVNGKVYDLGASNGNVGRALASMIAARNVEFIPVDSSAEMSARYHGPGKIITKAIEDIEIDEFDLVVCNLSLMFLSRSARGRVLEQLRVKRKPGGAVIVVEKFTTAVGYAATVMFRLTLAEKLHAGVEPGDILAKELSLAGQQVPLAEQELPANALEWFRFGDFAGYLISDDARLVR